MHTAYTVDCSYCLYRNVYDDSDNDAVMSRVSVHRITLEEVVVLAIFSKLQSSSY